MNNKTPLQRLKAATELASPGTWEMEETKTGWEVVQGDLMIADSIPYIPDAEFICLARQLVPLLMEYVELTRGCECPHASVAEHGESPSQPELRRREIEKELGL